MHWDNFSMRFGCRIRPRSVSSLPSWAVLWLSCRVICAQAARISAESIGITHMLLKKPRSVYFGRYTYDGENVLVRRSKTDAKYRSNAYTASAILYTRSGIFVSQKSFSLTDDRVNETVWDRVYGALEKAEVESIEHTFADEHKKNLFFVVITAEDGTKIRLPAEHNAALDRICEDINDQIKMAKNR